TRSRQWRSSLRSSRSNRRPPLASPRSPRRIRPRTRRPPDANLRLARPPNPTPPAPLRRARLRPIQSLRTDVGAIPDPPQNDRPLPSWQTRPPRVPEIPPRWLQRPTKQLRSKLPRTGRSPTKLLRTGQARARPVQVWQSRV